MEKKQHNKKYRFPRTLDIFHCNLLCNFSELCVSADKVQVNGSWSKCIDTNVAVVKKKSICIAHLLASLCEKAEIQYRLSVTQWLYREKINSI